MDSLLVLIGTCCGGVITGCFSLIIALLDRNQRQNEMKNNKMIEDRKLFSDNQRTKAIYLVNQIERFRQLEEKYIDEVVNLRSQINITPNKPDSVKKDFRDMVNDEDCHLNYSKSDYNWLLNFFGAEASVRHNDKKMAPDELNRVCQ